MYLLAVSFWSKAMMSSMVDRVRPRLLIGLSACGSCFTFFPVMCVCVCNGQHLKRQQRTSPCRFCVCQRLPLGTGQHPVAVFGAFPIAFRQSAARRSLSGTAKACRSCNGLQCLGREKQQIASRCRSFFPETGTPL